MDPIKNPYHAPNALMPAEPRPKKFKSNYISFISRVSAFFIPAMLIACLYMGDHFWTALIGAQIALIASSLFEETNRWISLLLGFSGMFLGVLLRIGVDNIKGWYDHNLWPIELAIMAFVFAVTALPGVFIQVIISRLKVPNDA